MEDGGWRMGDGGWRMEDGGWRMEDGGWRRGRREGREQVVGKTFEGVYPYWFSEFLKTQF
jgi:hypothetical protein